MIIRFWKWWFTPRSNDPTVVYRERALRFLLPVFFLFRVLAISNAYSSPTAPRPYFPIWVALATFIPLFLSLYFLLIDRIDWAGVLILLNWYLMDMINLPVDGYWNPGFQISLIIQVVLATLLLPSRTILPFLFFQIITVGLWGYWLNSNHFDPPLLSSGQPVVGFLRAIITVSVQETMILFIVRYLRLEMEKYLRLQQTSIAQLQNEITERRRLQGEREIYIDELNARNAELERFTYTVSHELKSPIVTVKNYIGSVNEDLHQKKYDRAHKDLTRISSAADKLHRTISDLLELSRIGRIVIPPEEIELAQLTREVLETIDGRIKAHNITVTISPDLPIVYGDRDRLREVFQNLIDNAAKYMGEQPNPSIEIGTSDNQNEQVIFVKDNGLGIELEYHKRIFGLFEKLDSTIEGTGIGLALIKRIIEIHGGSVWVESGGFGKGSTFCFTIPDSRKKYLTTPTESLS
jgi:signal transduction histidine kinase